jgi:hypothetical protein
MSFPLLFIIIIYKRQRCLPKESSEKSIMLQLASIGIRQFCCFQLFFNLFLLLRKENIRSIFYYYEKVYGHVKI